MICNTPIFIDTFAGGYQPVSQQLNKMQTSGFDTILTAFDLHNSMIILTFAQQKAP
jgi:hypothetical protein